MKRLSKASNSSKPRAAAHEHFYEAEDEKIPAQKAKFASLYEEAEADDVAEEEDDDVAGHALRRQPRKTCKLSSSKHGVNRHQQEEQQQQQKKKKFVCPKCGKGFQSSKAMCGHMACHSEKDKASNNSAAKQKLLVMDSHSDTESVTKNRRRSSRRRRSKVDVFNNCSSETSGVEEDQEEVAICLMMLSRDSANWGGLNSVRNSSDNNSVVVEARSISTKLANMGGLNNSGYGVDEVTKKSGSKKVKALGDFEGFVRNESENGETDVKIRNLKRNKLQEGYEGEPHLSLKKLKTAVDGRFKYDFSKDCERPEMDSGAEMCRKFEHKVPIHSHRDSHAYGASNQKSWTPVLLHVNGRSPDNHKGKGILEEKSGNVGDNLKSGKYEYSTCFNVLRSAQALGSHRMQHLHECTKKINKCDSFAAMFKRNRTQVHDSIDLNLPAPMEDGEAIETMDSYGRF